MVFGFEKSAGSSQCARLCNVSACLGWTTFPRILLPIGRASLMDMQTVQLHRDLFSKGAPHWSSMLSVEILTNFIFEFVFYKWSPTGLLVTVLEAWKLGSHNIPPLTTSLGFPFLIILAVVTLHPWWDPGYTAGRAGDMAPGWWVMV